MNLIEYIILAVIQGITEPLPISSSGHMLLFKNILNTNIFGNDLNFEIVCNFGSFIAIFIIFYKDIIKYVTYFFKFIFDKKNRNKYKKGFLYCLFVVISTIPVTITGLIFKDKIESLFENKIILIGFMFLITALALFIVRKFKGSKDDEDITLLDALIIGLFQAVTIIPGISRSGTVLVACLLCKLKRDSALRYTFILYFPVSIGAMILGVSDLVQSPNLSSLILPYAVGMVVAGVITYFSYEWLSNWVKRGKLAYFSIYCLLLAAFIFIYFR